MKLFEYMGKEIFRARGIPVPRGEVITQAGQAAGVLERIPAAVLKSQVLSGKRGKAGGIKFPSQAREAVDQANELLGQELQGYQVEKILVEEKLTIEREYYLAIAVENSLRCPVILASAAGGMDIEEVPEEMIVRRPVDPLLGVSEYVGREIAWRMGLSGEPFKQFAALVPGLYRLFIELDAELVEINPLVWTGEKLVAADAKVTVDDEALYRHAELPRVEEKTALEQKAQSIGLSFVELDGDIAIMANGAGITMATLDIIQHYGGRPANFLDAGGGANVEQTAQALELLLATNPRVIFINIFGGITRCDDVATAFAQVKKARGIPVPVVIRLVGTNEARGVEILRETGIEAYRSMSEAAAKAVELAQQA